MMPFSALASIQKSHVCLREPRSYCVDTQRSPIDLRNCGSERFCQSLGLGSDGAVREKYCAAKSRSHPATFALASKGRQVNRDRPFFFSKRQACSWETPPRNESATVSSVSRSSFLFFWRAGCRRSWHQAA